MIIVSHRGPFRFRRQADGDDFDVTRGAGGVVSALGPLLLGGDAAASTRWIAAAISDDDRAAVRLGRATHAEIDLHLLELDPELHRLHYDVVSNSVIWFLNHGLFDLVRRPRFDDRFTEAWQAYVAVNQQFADEVVACAQDEPVLVQDYQLALVPAMIRRRRPDLAVCYFHHTPFAEPDTMRVLPSEASRLLLESLTSGPAGFHARRWEHAYADSVRELLGGSPRDSFVAPLGVDAGALDEVARSAACEQALGELRAVVGDRQMIFRTDRLEPSKNIVRGFEAFELLLERRADLHGDVVFVAFLYPSRETLAEYLAYANEIDRVVRRINERFGTDVWTPVVIDVRDDYPQSVAGLRRYDVLLVNPIRDGLNLVAKEGPIVNERDGVVCLSPEAGVYEELADGVVECHPFDLREAATALGRALDMAADERRVLAARCVDLAAARTPSDWLDDQLRAVAP